MIDWKCEVHRFYLDKNSGFDSMMKLAFDVIFKEHDRLIFFEEDILPSESFFGTVKNY